MIKILSSADWHINLHRKKIPRHWQQQRFQLLFNKLLDLEKQCDVHIIAGDLFDKEPDADEICLILSYLNSVTIPTLIVPGNHEATAKGATFWEHFKLENTIKNDLVHISTQNERICLAHQWFCTFPYGSVQTNNLPAHVTGDILVTHIRGEVPPHISAEFDFDRLRLWKLVLLGDLHFNHKYKDYDIYYPGSPLNTTFDRGDKDYGVDIITLRSIEDYSVDFVNLNLPKLIRHTVSVNEPMVQDLYHHIIYEVTGTIDQLAKVKKTDMLDKKIVEKPTTNATLDLEDKSIYEELEMYLNYIKVSNTKPVLAVFKKLGIQ
jgi:DNA repair exonuclease SbcCD nuclease subunit